MAGCAMDSVDECVSMTQCDPFCLKASLEGWCFELQLLTLHVCFATNMCLRLELDICWIFLDEYPMIPPQNNYLR